MTPEKHHRYIIYVGDSFSASMAERDWKRTENRFQYHITDKHKYHPSIVSNHFNLSLRNFSYGGKSWWYSRHKLYQEIKSDPSLLKKTFAMVFTHTNSGRVNNENDNIVPRMRDLPDNGDPYFMELKRTDELFIKHIYSNAFQDWAQQQWFHEISREFGDIPTVHFHCFPYSLEFSDLLPGRKFTTPLVHVQVGEMSGTDSDIEYRMGHGDTRANHLNDHNNQALADTVIDALKNYQPGSSELDLSKFDVPNKNASRWPEPGFGTR